jgi:hypothetical protein
LDIKKFFSLYSFSFVNRFFCKLYISKRKLITHLKTEREKIRICIVCDVLLVIYSHIFDKTFKLGKSWINKKFIGLSFFIWNDFSLIITNLYVFEIHLNFQIYLNHKESWGIQSFPLMLNSVIVNTRLQWTGFSAPTFNL